MDDSEKVADILGIGRPRREMPSDIELLRGWGMRLDFMLRDETWEPGHLDWFIFRPDQHAAEGMIRLGIRYAHAIESIRDVLRFVEDRFQEFKDANPQPRCRFCSSYDIQDDDIRFCNDCGERDELPKISSELSASTSSNFADALLVLAQRIPVVAEAIGNAERGTAPVTAKPRSLSAFHKPSAWRKSLGKISSTQWGRFVVKHETKIERMEGHLYAIDLELLRELGFSEPKN